MKALSITTVIVAAATSAPSFAQSTVKIYGVLDVAVEHSRLNTGVTLNRMQQTGHVPTRLGFEGEEDLGGGLKAGFRLEQGFAAKTGMLLQGGRAFGREAWVSLGAKSLGELRLGRQYSVMQAALAKYDVDHLSQYSPVLAAQLSNIEQTSQDNVIKYITPQLGDFSATFTVAPAEGSAVTAANGPQVVRAGVGKRSVGAMLEYGGGPLSVGFGYQKRGQSISTGGSADQSVMSLGGIYDFGAFEVGALAWTHRNAMSNGLTPTTKLWSAGASWRVLPALRLVVQVGQATDNGKVYATGADKAKGSTDFVNIGATYDMSKRTAVYTRLGRISDENNGFNGRGALAAVTVRDATPMPANGSVQGISLGLRHRF